jgi:hypothetical protein
MAYGFQNVLVKGFVDAVVIVCGATEIARHKRSYGRREFVFNPLHYRALLEQEPGAFDQAAPLQNWTVPEPLLDLRRLLESRMGNRGKREFIQVLRLLEVFPETIVTAAALEAIRLGAISFDAHGQDTYMPCLRSCRLPAGLPRHLRTAAGLVHQLMEARDERRLLKLQAQRAAVKLLIVDELGYVPLSQTGAELLFEIFSQRHERGSTIVNSNLPVEEWTSIFGSQRLTGALLDRLTHHVHILELNGESYRLKQSAARRTDHTHRMKPATPILKPRRPTP